MGNHKLRDMERPGTYSRKTRAHLRGCLDSRVGYLATVPAIAAQSAYLKILFAQAFGAKERVGTLMLANFREIRGIGMPTFLTS